MWLPSKDGWKHPFMFITLFFHLYANYSRINSRSINTIKILVYFNRENIAFQIIKLLNQSTVLAIPNCQVSFWVSTNDVDVFESYKFPDKALSFSLLGLFTLLLPMKYGTILLQIPFPYWRIWVTSIKEF
jgi:hypothetical protein